MKRLLSLALLTLTVAACGDSPSDADNTGSQFDITIGTGTKPTYTWTGGTAQNVSVVRVSAPGTIVWGVASTAMTIPSPVTHGTTPGGGALVTASTEATLTAGTKYRVSVVRNDTKNGFKEFTP